MERPDRFFTLSENTSNSKGTERIPVCWHRSQLLVSLASAGNQSPLHAQCTPIDARDEKLSRRPVAPMFRPLPEVDQRASVPSTST
jgi:hypothetical protein